tara:strand:+ start:4399 stop:5337 length:939 start_codon:yes stop_codon:yes gene_type:complete
MAVRIYDAELGEGQALWEEERPWAWLMRKKRVMPLVLYNAQYRNDPRGLRGVRYDVEWLNLVNPNSIPPIRELVGVQGGDPATSERETSNYFGHCTGAKHTETGRIYVLGFDYGHIPAPGHMEFLKAQYDTWTSRGLNIQKVILEEGGPQQATTQNLAEKTRASDKPMPVEVLPPKGSKEQRFDSMMPFIRNGTVLFPGEEQVDGSMEFPEQPGFKEFQTEYTSFPRGGRDDVLDALWLVINDLVSLTQAAGVTGDTREGESQEDVWEHGRQEKERRLAEWEAQQQERSGGESTAKDRVLGRSGRGSLFHRR